MSTDIVTVQLKRDNEEEKWGFQISGGKDQNSPLVISEITPGSIAELVGLRLRDTIIKINNEPSADITNTDAEASVHKGGNNFALVIQRGELPNIVEDPRYEGLDEIDRAKVGGNDVSKPTLRRDWNCPWVKRDGKGLKRVVRNAHGEDPVSAPVKTSHHHFYSEPHSILAQEVPAEELERMIQEKMDEQQAHDDLSKQQQQPQRNQVNQQTAQPQPPVHQQNDHVAMEVDMAPQQPMKETPQKLQHHESLDDEEDFSCPPALETIEVQQQQLHEREQALIQQEQENKILNEFVQQTAVGDQQHFNQTIVRELAIAIKESMQNYQDMGENFEPSADELIDVLKNLENLAAINPALYRAIVEQIKTPAGSDQSGTDAHQQQRVVYDDETNGLNNVDDQEVPVENNVYEEINNHVSGEDVVDLQNGHADIEVQHVPQEMNGPPKSTEEIKKENQQELIRQQVEAEHEEQMKMLKQRKKKEATPPPPPKTITVMAGSQHRAAWPIAPGGQGATVPVQITLTSGSVEYEEEMMKNRFEVAQAAGLKHVERINGDERFYPEPMKDYDYPWAGSLKPVSNEMLRSQHKGRRGSGDAGGIPWAGSLRHVENKKRRQKQEDEDDMYGNAPWMGTLRHVAHENMVTKTIKPTPKFKKYPDEDAPNPFKGTQGKDARPKYPLTPAAVFCSPEEGGAKEENVLEAEQVDRIRNNLRETRTVSSSLLKVLMPKLLKEHESKYEPLGHDESFNIMEEILAMQIGLSADQKVEDNDEAEQIIRAITHGEIDHAVYSQMADDLENAAQQKRKEKKTGKKGGKKTGTGKKKTKKSAAGADESSKSGTEIEPSASESTIPPSAPVPESTAA